MNVLLKFKFNENLYLRDPERSKVGKLLVQNGIELIHEVGFERFTFKKLAKRIHSTEATIYRYFASKHRFLTYILNWYWCYMEFIAIMSLKEQPDPVEKLKLILDILTHNYDNNSEIVDYDLQKLHEIVILVNSKAYLLTEVEGVNQEQVFGSLNNLSQFIGRTILEINPKFTYPNSLASTLLETAHSQHFFSEHLPKLTDNTSKIHHKKYVLDYLNLVAFSLIK